MSRRAVIVGAGVGGLATASLLQRQGYDTLVLERTARPGGRCNVLEVDDFRFDTGPTLLLMPDVLDAFFAQVGRRRSDYLELLRSEPNYVVRYADGSSLEFTSDVGQMRRNLDALEPGAGDRYHAFLDDAGYKYRVARESFVERNFRRAGEFFTLGNLQLLVRTGTLGSLYRHVGRYFRDDRLRLGFTFQSMYLGISPYAAPAIYALLPYTELVEGIWMPRGGMYRLVEALVRLLDELGGRVRLGAEVARIELKGNRAVGVTLKDGELIPADLVVANADLPYVYDRLIPKDAPGRIPLSRLRYGCSAFLFFLGLDRPCPELTHHSVFLSADPGRNFRQIFKDFTVPDDPSFYVAAPARTDAELAPEGRDQLFVLVPCPTLSKRPIDWQRAGDRLRDVVFSRLAAAGLGDLESRVQVERRFSPADFRATYNLARGNSFGISHDFLQVGYFRPPNRAVGLENLYFVGASTAPGGGLPMVLIGARLVADRIAAEQVALASA